MNKRYALWGSLVAAMALVVIVVVQFADEQPEVSQASTNTQNQNNETELPDELQPRENDWTQGNPDADVVIVKYSDFQCPACRIYASMDDRFSKEMGDDVLFVFRYFPLQSFSHSFLAARYAEAAGRQGEFWRMHDLIYINQQRWSNGNAESIFRQFADSIDLDMEQLDADLQDPGLEERINADYESGVSLGVNSVPTIYINGDKVQNINSMEAYRDLIESYL